MKKEAEAKLDVKLRHGTLYRLLNRLEKERFITGLKQKQGGRTRKVYTLTEKAKST